MGINGIDKKGFMKNLIKLLRKQQRPQYKINLTFRFITICKFKESSYFSLANPFANIKTKAETINFVLKFTHLQWILAFWSGLVT